MSYSVSAARRNLLRQTAAALIAVGLIVLLPYRDIAVETHLWFLAPFHILAAHLLTGAAYLITSRRPRRAWSLLKGSFAVYGSLASATHLVASLLTALLEETVFRLVLLFWLRHTTGSAIAAVLITSVVFSAGHTRLRFRSKSLPAYADYFLFGCVLATVTLLTRSLLPALLIHAFRNYILRCMLVSREEYDELNRRTESS